jgi:hypothetical protein
VYRLEYQERMVAHLVPADVPAPSTSLPSLRTKCPEPMLETSPGCLGVIVLRKLILAANCLKRSDCVPRSFSLAWSRIVCLASSKACVFLSLGSRLISDNNSLYAANILALCGELIRFRFQIEFKNAP